jgi:hypothetical protein
MCGASISSTVTTGRGSEKSDDDASLTSSEGASRAGDDAIIEAQRSPLTQPPNYSAPSSSSPPSLSV